MPCISTSLVLLDLNCIYVQVHIAMRFPLRLAINLEMNELDSNR